MPVRGSHRIELQGVFDRPVALRVGDLVRHLRRGGQLLVDVSRVREFHGTALAALAFTLKHADEEVRVQVTGLRHQQLRMLRYLGWAPPAERWEDEVPEVDWAPSPAHPRP